MSREKFGRCEIVLSDSSSIRSELSHLRTENQIVELHRANCHIADDLHSCLHRRVDDSVVISSDSELLSTSTSPTSDEDSGNRRLSIEKRSLEIDSDIA